MKVKIKGEGPVLVVDDSRDALKIAEFVFKDSRVKNEVLFFANGQSVLDYLEELSDHVTPSLVLLDINMPIPDGFEVLRRIRSWERFRNLPIVILTSSNDDDDMRRALSAGANDYQVKPFEIDAFVNIVNDLIPNPSL